MIHDAGFHESIKDQCNINSTGKFTVKIEKVDFNTFCLLMLNFLR